MQNFLQQIQQQLDSKLPFVAYRKPNDSIVNAIFQNDASLNIVKDFTETGFVFAPFNTDKKSILIPIDKQIKVTYKSLKTESFPILNEVFDKQKHINLVTKAILALQTDEYNKIVLSRKIDLTVSAVNPIVLFQQLLALYTSAFVYVWYHPKVGCWLGATPETLLQTRGNAFKTMSLAGTKKYADALEWKAKEKEEQQMVTDYITNCLQQQNITHTVSKPYTAQAGHLAHIRTDISGRMLNNNLSDIIAVLHPTPAVCGLPKNKSKQFILENEGYDRQFYTGFMGELNFETTRKNNRRNTENHAYNFTVKTSNLFVNLRCMEVQENAISIYVGGGITAQSNAQSEYQETVNKAQTMLQAIRTPK